MIGNPRINHPTQPTKNQRDGNIAWHPKNKKALRESEGLLILYA
jgi:hypothetical protein